MDEDRPRIIGMLSLEDGESDLFDLKDLPLSFLMDFGDILDSSFGDDEPILNAGIGEPPVPGEALAPALTGEDLALALSGEALEPAFTGEARD